MDGFGAWLDIAGQLAAIVGAAAGVVAVFLTIRPPGSPARHRFSRQWWPLTALLALIAAAVLAHRIPSTPPELALVASWSVPVLGLLAVALAGRRWRRPRVPLDGQLTALLRAQRADAARHRYRFFAGHVPALTDVYVRQRAISGASGKGVGSAAAAPAIDVPEMLAAQRHTVLLGGAGSGKSTLVANMIGTAAQRALHGDRASLTVAVPAPDLVDQPLPEAVALVCRRDLNIDVPASIFGQPPAVGAYWRVLVDGLDEVISTEHRSRLLWRLHGWFDDPTLPYRFVVTTRPLPEAELAELRHPEAGVYELRPFDRRDLDAFARRWFAARHRDEPALAADTAARFTARVAGIQLGPVARVPLLATIAALVFEAERGGALPSGLADLYARCVDHLLDGRRTLSEVRAVLDPLLLARGEPGAALAAWLGRDFYGIVSDVLDAVGQASVEEPTTDLVAVAAEWLGERGPYDLRQVLPEAVRILRDLLLSTGLFVLRRDRLAFTHRSFAEFFAARADAARFDRAAWRVQAANPATRGLAAFAAARRPDSDQLVASLLGTAADPAAAGDLVSDGVPVTAATRHRVVEALVTQVREPAGNAPECLRVLRNLSGDPWVLCRLVDLANGEASDPWTRAIVAGAIADVDRSQGIPLLRFAAASPEPALAAWAAGALAARGAFTGPQPRSTRWDRELRPAGRPLGTLAQQALRQRADDSSLSDADRAEAAAQLAAGGDPQPLRALLATSAMDDYALVRAAAALADLGDDAALLRFARGAGERRPPPPPRSFDPRLWLRYGAVEELFLRGHPAVPDLLRALERDYERRPGHDLMYGVAARLADLGEFSVLTRVAMSRNRHIGRFAAAHLARVGDPHSLDRVAAAPVDAVRQAWALAGLVRHRRPEAAARLRELLRHHAFGFRLRSELYYWLASYGDLADRRWLRRWAFRRWAGPRRRMTAAVALTALGDPTGPAVATRVARGPCHGARLRVWAAGNLARVHPRAGRDLLAALAAATNRSRVRLAAASWLAQSPGDPAALCELILDPRVPARWRQQAVEQLRRVVATPVRPSADERVYSLAPNQPAPRQLIAADPGTAPEPYGTRLIELALRPATPARVRTAIAATVLPQDAAASVLASVVDDRRVHSWTRAVAAIALAEQDLPSGTAAFQAIIQDGRISRLVRWYTLLLGYDLLDPDAAGAVDARLRRIEEDSSWRGRVRLAALLLTRPERLLDQGRSNPVPRVRWEA